MSIDHNEHNFNRRLALARVVGSVHSSIKIAIADLQDNRSDCAIALLREALAVIEADTIQHSNAFGLVSPFERKE
jgi:hypothetical protein